MIAMKDVVQQTFETGTKQNRVVSQVLVPTIGSEVHHEQRHGPLHSLQSPANRTRRIDLVVKVGVRVVHIGI